jgi:hypothetical protein
VNDDPRAEAREQTVHEKAIEAGARALGKVILPTDEAYAAAVVDAVEPIIRADLRAEALDWRVGVEVRQIIEVEVRERLRAQVEALPAAMIVAGVWIGEPPDKTDWDDPVVFQSDVLALLDGEK